MRTYRCWLLALGMALCSVGMAQNVSADIDRLMNDALLTTADASVAVYDLTDDAMLYSHRADKLCRPASVQKVLTTVTALNRLGTDYTLDTELYITGVLGPDSILQGDLYVVGGFDSEFTSADMDRLIATIPTIGIRSITGSIVADISMADTTYWGSGWCWDDAPAAFQPYYSPLMIDKGCVEVTVTPTTAGAAASVTCAPASSWYEIDNHTVCHDETAGPLRITRDWKHGSNRIIVSGNVERSHSKKLSLFTSDRHFFVLFTERYLRSGLGATDFRYGVRPNEARLVAIMQRPIVEVVEQALKKSDNLSAEALFYHTAAANGKPYASATDAVMVTDSLLQTLYSSYGNQKGGIYPHKTVDGSGLSNYNMMSAHMLLDVLRYAYHHPNIYDIISKALPHSGVDGTLKGRMGTSSMRGRIVAKTGSMTGVSTLAGYAHASNGHVLAFVIMNQNVPKLSQARTWQDKVCRAICGISQ